MANYWYVSSTHDGWQNLALDEWFLEHLQPDDFLLYFYINRNAVIIGKNQNPWKECNLQAMERDEVQLVRRITGGGAVYHDCGNLNFSFIAGDRRYDVEKQLNLILRAVTDFGIPCDFSGRNDLLADGKKFSGNAFCSRNGIRQHHGTLLIQSDLSRLQNYLQVDPRKMKAKGVASVRSRVCNLSEFSPDVSVDTMLTSIRRAYEALYGPVTDVSLSPEQLATVVPYYQKHSSWQWRLGKTPGFDLELDPRFSWGGVQLLLTLQNGTVADLTVFSDGMDPELPEKIRTLLLGCRFQSEAMHQMLMTSDNAQLHDLAEYLLQQNL